MLLTYVSTFAPVFHYRDKVIRSDHRNCYYVDDKNYTFAYIKHRDFLAVIIETWLTDERLILEFYQDGVFVKTRVNRIALVGFYDKITEILDKIKSDEIKNEIKQMAQKYKYIFFYYKQIYVEREGL